MDLPERVKSELQMFQDTPEGEFSQLPFFQGI